MKKVLLFNLALAVMCASLLTTSCKKIVHPAHPGPTNSRIVGYSKYSTSTTGTPPINESFRFYYDGNQRLTQIAYSSNDSVSQYNPVGDFSEKLINFTYSNDTIYKVYKSTRNGSIFERDTFIKNSFGLIVRAYTPGEMNNFQYYGHLLARTDKSVNDSGTTMSAGTSYTSDNGDLLIRSYDGNLYVTFPDSGISTYLINHDTALTPPLTVHWTIWGHTIDSEIHTTGFNVYNDVLTNYNSGFPVSVQAKDRWGVTAYDTLFWPGGIWSKESFFVYPDLLDRDGDYLQIESFTMYGANLYQNNHLVRQIVEDHGPTTTVTYTIDADSKITQTYVKKTDQFYNVYTTVYKFQYETF